jgi:hypothetical protein
MYFLKEQNIARVNLLHSQRELHLSYCLTEKWLSVAYCCASVSVQFFSCYALCGTRSITCNFQETGIFAESYSLLSESFFFRNHVEISLSISLFLSALNVACNDGSSLLTELLSNFSITCDFLSSKDMCNSSYLYRQLFWSLTSCKNEVSQSVSESWHYQELQSKCHFCKNHIRRHIDLKASCVYCHTDKRKLFDFCWMLEK